MIRRASTTLSIFTFLVLFPSNGTAQSNRLSASDIFDMEFATAPRISPDGEWVVYVRQFADIMTDRRYSNLWILRADGSDHRPLTTGHFNDHTPRWSPDGERLAYISDRSGTPQIHVRWMDSRQTATVTNVTEPPSGVEWSPDGRQLAFLKLVPEAPLTIVDMPQPPSGATWAEPPQIEDKLIYRFNGVGDLEPGFVHLFVMPSEGGTPRQVSHGRFQHGGPAFGGSWVRWTPDSRHLIVSANRRDDYELEPRDTDVYAFDVSDGSVRQVTTRHGPDNTPVVSPDGRTIAYVGFDERNQGYQLRRLYVNDFNGAARRVLASDLDRSIYSPQWAADNSGVYAMFDDQGDSKLGFFGLDGSHRVVAEHLGSSGSAYGGSGTFTVSTSGTVVMTISDATTPADIAVSRSGGKPDVLTTVNQDVLAGKQLGAVEEFWYESSKNGRPIQGWIITPPNFDPSLRYPMIIEIHGGPFANYGARFDLEKQIMAAKGYVVLYTNPRGSTSYGEEFGNLIHHAYPGDDFYDLNSGVDAVIERGFVDPAELYVAGGSGGGVLTAWMIGNTDRFRAAVSWYPVINWYSFNLTSDIAPFTVANWFPGLPWDNVEHYESRSLLSVVENVKTPTMIMTGEEDYRTPMSESEQYFKALKLLGVETVLVRVPGEPHGIRRRPSHHIAKMLGMLQWLEQHSPPTM